MTGYLSQKKFTGPKPLKFTEARRHFRAQRGDSVKDRFVELVPGSNGPESVDVLKSTVRSISWMKVNPRWPSIRSSTCAHSGHHRLQRWAVESKMVKSYAQNSECCSAHTQVTISTVKFKFRNFLQRNSSAWWTQCDPPSNRQVKVDCRLITYQSVSPEDIGWGYVSIL